MALRQEPPASGSIDGINTTFTVPTAYLAGSMKHYYNGALIEPSLDNGLVETDPSLGIVDLKEAPEVDDVIVFVYDDDSVIEVVPAINLVVKTLGNSLVFAEDYRQKELLFVEGDRLPILTFELQAGDGSAVDLTGASAVFKFRRRGDTLQKNKGDDAATITGPTTGKIKYEWRASDLDTFGRFEGELKVTFPSSLVQTTMNRILFSVRTSI